VRVKISYTVDIEEVEKKVSEIMVKASDNLEFACQEVIRVQLDLSTKTGSIDDKLQLIDQLRHKLSSADQVLEDCYLILDGLKQAKIQIKERQNEIQDG
jgi:hypothetical protein